LSAPANAALGDAIARLVRRVPDAFFLQIGGFDGESFDPLRPHVLAHNLRGLIVEPIPQYYEKLRALYAGSPAVRTANVAVAEQDGERTLWRFNPEAVEKGLLLPHFAGISSFVMEDLLSDSGVLGRSSPNAETTAILRKLVQPVAVQCRTMESLLQVFSIDRVDILQIDTEGYDFVILKLFDFARHRPFIVHYEHQHLSAADAAAAAALLSGFGYRLIPQQFDTLAVRETPLAGEELRTFKSRAFAQYNAHRERGEIEQAEIYAADLAAMLPDHVAILEAAFECNRLLGRLGKATDYAMTILNIDTTHRQATTFIAEMRASPETVELEIARRMTFALATPRAGTDELYRLRDLHAAASAILSGTLDDRNVARLHHILDVTATIPPPFPAGSRGAHWEKYFRRKLEAIDLSALTADTLPDEAEAPVAFSTTKGEALDWRGVRATAERLGARVVFFAAADEGYVARYAKWYAATILLRCDVPCLVVIHVIGGVIGGAANLAAIAAAVGVSDPRLIFAGDSFDAAAVTATVIDSPNDTRHTLPVTHYQSVRFLQLGAVLKHLNLPVFVSDIDMLLQRGVADLLEAHAQADAVFNENIYALSLADRLTANLLLVYPTANAALFARFLRVYLEKHLRQPEIIRWIDQIGLLLGRHYLRGLEGARTGAFDTASDINNTIFPTYVQNPYRFLSLYQGFDMASLAVPAPVKPPNPHA